MGNMEREKESAGEEGGGGSSSHLTVQFMHT